MCWFQGRGLLLKTLFSSRDKSVLPYNVPIKVGLLMLKNILSASSLLLQPSTSLLVAAGRLFRQKTISKQKAGSFHSAFPFYSPSPPIQRSFSEQRTKLEDMKGMLREQVQKTVFPLAYFYFILDEDDQEEANSSSFFFSLISILQDSGNQMKLRG